MSENKKVRVRFAPSPTGYLHIGGLRTALYNYLLARRHGGAFVLRIEDTDQTRFVSDAEQDIMESLAWAGLTNDEGPGIGGVHAPYRQSERSDRYRLVAEDLVARKKAYIAFDSSEEIEALKKRHVAPDNPNPRYDFSTRSEMVNSLTLSQEEVTIRLNRGDEHVVRLLVTPGHEVSFEDAVRGVVSFESDAVDDQILVKSDGLPTYHLANIVDDHDMEITHVIRGEEWLSSTPKHILLYDAMSWKAPIMAHLPLILSPTGGKLSKRNADKQGIPVSVVQYREAGYEPEALINFLALLGWNPGHDQEIMSLSEMVELFSLDRVGLGGVQFDLQKLTWFNEQYLRSRTPGSIAHSVLSEVTNRFGSVSVSYLESAIGLVLDRMSFAKDIVNSPFLFEDPIQYDEKSVQKRWKEDSASVLVSFCTDLESVEEWTAENLDACLKSKVEREEIGLGKIMFPVRLGLTGLPSGPDLFAMMELLGKEVVIRRLRAAAAKLG